MRPVALLRLCYCAAALGVYKISTQELVARAMEAFNSENGSGSESSMFEEGVEREGESEGAPVKVEVRVERSEPTESQLGAAEASSNDKGGSGEKDQEVSQPFEVTRTAPQPLLMFLPPSIPSSLPPSPFPPQLSPLAQLGQQAAAAISSGESVEDSTVIALILHEIRCVCVCVYTW